MGQVLSSVINWFLGAYQNTDHVITILDGHRDQSDYWSTVVDPDHDFPNQDQNRGELFRYDGDFEGGAFDDRVSTPSTSSEEQSPHSSVDDPKEVNPLSIVVVDNGEQSTPCRGDFEELKKFVDVISRPIEEIKKEIWIKHYCSSHKILLVGEGDFSFSACLGRAFGRANNMVATSLDSQDFLKKNYGRAMSNIQSLRSRGCIVIHNVDATKMAGNRSLNNVTYDRIVYNFPHAGFSKNEPVKDHLRRNRDLVSDFMANAAKMIDETGEIHISHKCNGFFQQWGLQKLGEKKGLVLIKEVEFKLSDYPGYNTKYGYGGDENFDCNPSRTYKFRLKDRRPIEEIKKEIWIKHYCSSHKILLVGEGDFSFSACLGRAFGRADNMVATSLNSQDFLKKNYGQAMPNIQSLRSRGCKVIHKVNATEMAGNKKLNVVKYDRIVYNFPHAGFSSKESVTDEIRKHQDLVSLFMANAKKMIEEKGEIHISHKCNKFFEQWGLRKLAKENGLAVMEEVKFNLSDYPGYNTKYGFGGDKNFDCNPSKTYKFRLKKRASES